MRYFYSYVLCIAFLGSLQLVQGQVVNSIANGSASVPGTWDCSCVPGSAHDVVVHHVVTLGNSAVYNSLTVNSGASFTTNTSGNTQINNDLLIEVGATFTNHRRIDIYGNYTVDGVHSGSNNIFIRGTGNILAGIPTGYISNTARLIFSDGDKTIAVGSSITKNFGKTQLQAGVRVHNFGAYQGSQFLGQSGALWINHTGSWLAIRSSWSGQLGLDARAAGNIVVYNRLSTGDQILANSVDRTYWDLIIQGNDLGSRKILRDDITILNDLTIGTSTLDPRRAGVDWDITIYGNWDNQSGYFARRTSKVTFIAFDGIQIDHPVQERFYDLVVSGPDTVTLNTDIDVKNSLAIKGVLDVDAVMSNTIDLQGDLIISGELLPRFGEIAFVNSGAKKVIGNILWNNLTINTPGSVTLQGGVQTIKGTLTLTNGNLETNGLLTLLSDSVGTARIDEVTGGTLSGDITVQRYINAGATNWRFLSTPVSGRTLADWDDDFVTSGFIGSDFPSFPFISIYSYDESQPGTNSDGFVAVSADTDPINVGEGYWVWCGDSLGGTAPFTIDVKGPANIGTTALPIQYTTVSGPTNDGWCMVGNPFASTINWDDPSWTKTNVEDAIYIWDPSNQQFASYINGIGANGGSPYIPSSQAFWVKASAPSPVLDVPESAKSVLDIGFKSNPIVDGVTFEISGNGFTDETIIRAQKTATSFFDPTLDAIKMFSSNPNVPSINTQILGPVDMAINSVPELEADLSIPLRTMAGVSGSYTITATEVNGTFGNSCIMLEDLYTGNITTITEGASYLFTLADTTDLPRFLLHIGVPVQNNVFNTSCAGTIDGSSMVTGAGNGPWDYTWNDDQGNILQTDVGMSGPGIISGLSAGNYSVEVNTAGNCPSVTIPFEVESPEVISVSYAISNAYCEGSTDGSIDIEVTGGTAPYLFNWSNGSQSEDQDLLDPGTYTVNIEDMNHCAQDLTFDVEQSYGVAAAFTTSATEVLLSEGAEVIFTNASIDANEYRWNFGDGSPIQFGTDAVHAYTAAGIYTVNLRAINLDCIDDITTDITVVNDITGIGELSGMDGISVEQNDQGLYLVIELNEPADLSIEVFNSIGQALEEKRSGNYLNDRIEIKAGNAGSVILITVINEESGEIFTNKVVRR